MSPNTKYLSDTSALPDMRKRQTITVVATLAYAVGMLAYVHLVLPTNPPADTIGMAAFVLGGQAVGMIVLGGPAIYLLLRFGLVSPVAFVALCTALSLYDLVDGASFTVLYVGWWFFFVFPVAVLAAGEYALREWLDFFPPKPVV